MAGQSWLAGQHVDWHVGNRHGGEGLVKIRKTLSVFVMSGLALAVASSLGCKDESSGGSAVAFIDPTGDWNMTLTTDGGRAIVRS